MTRHLIIGGAGGVGGALAARLRARGESVVLAGRTEATLAARAAEIGAAWRVVDARDFDAMERLVGALVAEPEGLFGLVCCAGSILLKPAHLTTAADFEATVATNLTTAFATVRAAGRHLTGTGGSVVLFSTAAARLGLANHEAIAAAKAGIEGLVRSAAATYGARGLCVNAIAPGLVDTALAQRITGNPRSLEASRALHVRGRIGTADEVASLAAWLLGEDARWVTGQTLGIDGGLGVARAAGS
jgi:3-oxoacyl-[acyl-carrier protein] reductase